MASSKQSAHLCMVPDPLRNLVQPFLILATPPTAAPLPFEDCLALPTDPPPHCCTGI